MEKKIIELTVDDFSGNVNAIALVEYPAIEIDFMKFALSTILKRYLIVFPKFSC